jgi:large repetitive protein
VTGRFNYGNLVTSNGFGYEGPFTLTQTGNYKLVVETNGANKGQYAFSLIDVAAVPNLEFDRLVSGTLAPGSEADLFRFVGTAGENLYFDKLSSYSNLNWILYSPQNDTIWLDGWADKEFKLPYSGEYLLALRGQGSFAATGDYKFNVVTPDVVITQLELNRTISGAIVDKGEQHIYTFAGNAGQQLFYDSMGRDYLSLKLLDPAGNTIFTDYTNSDRGPDQGFTLTATGTYQVVVDGIGEGTGSYQFRLLDRTTSQTAALDTDLVGRLDNLLAAQGYQFSLNSDRYIYFDAQAGSGQWLLYGGDGKNLVAHPLSGDRELKLVAGDYFLVFQGNGSGDANYKMRLVTPEFITTPLVFNTVVTGNISEAGEQDTFTFDGVAGQRLFYDALGGSNLTKKIYDPSGKEVSSPFLDVRTDVGPDYYVLSSSGTYRVVIDGADTNIGSYKFRLIDESAASVINFDQEVTGTIDQDGLGATIYKFAAIAGQHLYLNASVSQSTNSWIIYAPNGQQMSSASLQSSYEFDVKSTGDYLLCIQGNGTVDRNYKFTLTDSNNAISSFALGEKVDGRIAKQGQQNTYVFQGTVGQQLYFDALGSTNASNEIVSIYNRSGVEVLRRSFSNIDAGDVIVLKETGDYRVVVDGFGGSTDSYSFRLSDVQSAAVSISHDADVVGQLVSGQETNFYKFNGIQGQRIQLNSLVSTPNTSMTLYDIVGDAVITAGATTTLTSTGQYIIGVRGYNNGSVNYGFRVVTISTPSTSPISNATPINQYSGQIYSSRDPCWRRV